MRLGVMVAVLVGLTVVLCACPLRLAVVAGDSMTPTLKSGQLVLIDRTYYQSQPILPGDVVALRMRGQVMVKRVSSVAGAQPAWARGVSQHPEKVFVVGDAGGISWDSREFGAVPIDWILGRVIGLEIRPRMTAYVSNARGSDG